MIAIRRKSSHWLPGKPRERIFVNVPSVRQIAVIDRRTGLLVSHWTMDEFQSNFPMALDEVAHRLLVGCRKPARLVVLDTQNTRGDWAIDANRLMTMRGAFSTSQTIVPSPDER